MKSIKAPYIKFCFRSHLLLKIIGPALLTPPTCFLLHLGDLRKMGAFATEMSATHCLPFRVNAVIDTEVEWAYILVKELMKCLAAQAVKILILPTIQKILQAGS